MSQVKFDQDNTVNTPKKILDAGPTGAFVGLQVLDASTLFFDVQRDILEIGGLGAAAPNNIMGFQIKAAAGFVTMWWKGEMWGRSDTNGGLINAAILFKLKARNAHGGAMDDPPPVAMDEL
jgi:hypothetical protein